MNQPAFPPVLSGTIVIKVARWWITLIICKCLSCLYRYCVCRQTTATFFFYLPPSLSISSQCMTHAEMLQFKIRCTNGNRSRSMLVEEGTGGRWYWWKVVVYKLHRPCSCWLTVAQHGFREHFKKELCTYLPFCWESDEKMDNHNWLAYLALEGNSSVQSLLFYSSLINTQHLVCFISVKMTQLFYEGLCDETSPANNPCKNVICCFDTLCIFLLKPSTTKWASVLPKSFFSYNVLIFFSNDKSKCLLSCDCINAFTR